MKKNYLIILVLILVFILVASFIIISRGRKNSDDVLNSAQLEIQPSTYDWGEIPHDKEAIAEIKLINTGDNDVEIYKITTSCSCTTAEFLEELDNKTISPGGEKILTVVFDPTFHKDQELGPVTREVYIKTNIPDQEEVVIRLEGTIVDQTI